MTILTEWIGLLPRWSYLTLEWSRRIWDAKPQESVSFAASSLQMFVVRGEESKEMLWCSQGKDFFQAEPVAGLVEGLPSAQSLGTA